MVPKKQLKRIAIISDHASPLAKPGSVDSGGQNVYVAHVARNLARMGYKVDVFTRRDHEDLPTIMLWEDGVRIIHVPAGPPEFVPKEELLAYMPDFTDFMVDFMMTRRLPYDLVHANFWMSGLVAADIKQTLGIPFVITFHALGKVRREHQGEQDAFPDIRFRIEDRIVQEADYIIAECPQDEEDLQSFYGAAAEKMRMIPCGFDPEEIWPVGKLKARQQLGISPDERVILQLGRMVPRKGIENVIRALSRLIHVEGIEARLFVVGGGSEDPDPEITPEIGRLQRIAEEERIADNVTFIGRRGRQALKYFYSAADVFVSTPWYEPFGITPVEAMASGTPVIGSKVGGIQYTVADGETGYHVPPKNPEALAKKLAYIFRHPEQLEELGQAAVRRANQLFTWRKVSQAIADLIEDLLTRQLEALTLPADFQLMLQEKSSIGIVALEKKQFLLSGNGNGSSLGSGSPSSNGRFGAAGSSYEASFTAAVNTLQRSREALSGEVEAAAQRIIATLSAGNKILIAGNGGSAAQAQHFAAELMGRYKIGERAGLPVIALTADTAFLTAWSNDVSYDQIFARQVQALGRSGDLLIGMSTSGRSQNLVNAFAAARNLGMDRLAFLGGDGGGMLPLSTLALVVPSDDTPRIQEVHLLLLHLLCEWVDNYFAESGLPANWVALSAEEEPIWELSAATGKNPIV